MSDPTPVRVPVRRALLGVYDKTGVEELAAGLAAAGVELVSTGATARRIAEAGIPVTPVEQVTGFPECLDGRVKTLHPAVHAGILADRRKPGHVAQLEELGIAPFDLVVVNLYPFTATVASGARRWCGPRRRTPRRWPSSSIRPGMSRCWRPSRRAGSRCPSAGSWRPPRSATPRPTTSLSPPGWATSWRPTTRAVFPPGWGPAGSGPTSSATARTR